MEQPFTPYEGQKPYIFVDYSHQDSDRVLPILTELDRHGYRIWYDVGIPWGSDWVTVIEEHIDRCSIYMVFLSQQSVQSQYVQNGTYYACKLEKPVLPVYLEEVTLNLGLRMHLSRYQSVNLYNYSSIMVIRRKTL